MRNAFARALKRLAADDPRVVLLSGDIGNRMFDAYKAQNPERFLNCGVAEANMTGVAAGLAIQGFRPFTYTIVPFVTTRCLEQIRVDICYHQLPVTIVGVGGGISYASLGATHHACEDIALLRALPEMQVICPADAVEVELAIEAVLQQNKPAYIRLGKKNEPVLHQSRPEFQIGQAIPMQPGEDICLLACGTILAQALETAQLLAQKHQLSVAVYSFHSVKPLDSQCLQSVMQRFPLVVTLEEHSLVGGFGAAVAEWAIDQQVKTSILRLGSPDQFPHAAATRDSLYTDWGLHPEQLLVRILERWNALQ